MIGELDDSSLWRSRQNDCFKTGASIYNTTTDDTFFFFFLFFFSCSSWITAAVCSCGCGSSICIGWFFSLILGNLNFNVQKRSSKTHVSGSKLLGLFILDSFQVSCCLSRWFVRFDWVVDNNWASVNSNDLDSWGMDSKWTSNLVNEWSSSTIIEEFVHGPFHPDHCLNGISWLNEEFTASCNIELKNVRNSDVSILSTCCLHNSSITSWSLVPSVHINYW